VSSTSFVGRRRASALAALFVLAACTEDDPAKLTQIVVVIDSDLRVPEGLDGLQIEVSGAKAKPAIDTTLDAEHRLPRSLGLVYSGGPLGPVRVQARGTLAGESVVERWAEVYFRKDRTLKLALPLTRLCAEKQPQCESDQTCDLGECVSAAITNLPTFDGNDGPFVADGGSYLDGSMSPAPSDDAGPDQLDGSTDGGQSDAAPSQSVTCTISEPADGDSFYDDEPVDFAGSCTASDGRNLGVRWSSSSGEVTGSKRAMTKGPLTAGTHDVTLCNPDGSVCAEQIQIEVQPTVAVDAHIASLTQAGASDDVYTANVEINASGEAAGIGNLTMTWIDSLQGELGAGESVRYGAPIVPGKHTLRLIVKDGRGREKIAEREFTVNVPERDALFDAYSNVNDLITGWGTITAVASEGGYLYGGTNMGRIFRVPASGSPQTVSLNSGVMTNMGSGVNDIFVDSAFEKIYVATSTNIQTCAITPDGLTACQPLMLPKLPTGPRCVRRVGSTGNEYLVVGTTKGLWVSALSMLDKGSVYDGNAIFSAVSESQDKLWIGGSTGLFGYALGGALSGSPEKYAGGSGALSGLVASADIIWGALSSGIARYTAADERWDSWTSSTDNALFGRLLSNDVRSIAITHPYIDGVAHDVIWVATSAGLSRFDPEIPSFTNYTKSDGLPDNTVLRVVGLPSNELLLATPTGLVLHRGQ
jgi:hypothetical protein